MAFWSYGGKTLGGIPLPSPVRMDRVNIRSEWQGNWTLHMDTVASMLPCFFGTDRTNYSLWIPAYLLEMSQTTVDIQTAFEDGEFSFTEIPGSFNGI